MRTGGRRRLPASPSSPGGRCRRGRPVASLPVRLSRTGEEAAAAQAPGQEPAQRLPGGKRRIPAPQVRRSQRPSCQGRAHFVF